MQGLRYLCILILGVFVLTLTVNYMPSDKNEEIIQFRVEELKQPTNNSHYAIDYDLSVLDFHKQHMKKTIELQEMQYETELQDLGQAKEFLDAGRVDDALSIIHMYEAEMENLSQTGVEWLTLLLNASLELEDLEQMQILHECFPWIMRKNEAAALFLAENYLKLGETEHYEELREDWIEREGERRRWFFLDADYLVLQKDFDQAKIHLNSQFFDSKDDVERLIRLVLLSYEKEPKIAWEHLSQAIRKDPYNSDLYLYRANFLENKGDHTQAHQEYLAAVKMSPLNPFYKDQLGEFYFRSGHRMKALTVWSDAIEPPSTDRIWLKAYFWSRMLKPLDYDFSSYSLPEGELQPLLSYLISLSKGEHWNDDKFQLVDDGPYFTSHSQCCLWLQIVESLKQFDDEKAMKLLRFNPFSSSSWNPELERALMQILSYRQNGRIDISSWMTHEYNFPSETSHLFFQQLQDLAQRERDGEEGMIPLELHDLLLSREAFAAVFLAGGWKEAALQTHALYQLPSGMPEWVSVGIMEALRENRNKEIALDFALQQEESPLLSLAIAEIYIEENQPEKALETIYEYAEDNSLIGYQASWLCSLICIDCQEYEEAKRFIISQPLLANDLLGKETLAKIAFLQEDVALAEQIYSTIVKESVDARTYFATKAYQDKDWQRARELTQELIKIFPDDITYRKNLEKILEAEAKYYGKSS